jgi:outer membrane biosynthesis protein TonB
LGIAEANVSDAVKESKVIKLRLLRAGKVIRSYKIKSDTFTVGSAKGCTIRAAGDKSVLPKHATAYIEDGELVLVPEPGGEVLLNGEAIDFAVPGPDDVIKIGRLTFKAELGGSGESIAPPPGQAAVPPKRASVPPVRPSAPPPRRSTPPPAIAAEAAKPEPQPKPEVKVKAKPKPKPKPKPKAKPKAAPAPPVARPIDLGPEPDAEFYFSDYDDDEEGFTEPFDLTEELVERPRPAREEGPKEPYCAAHVVRVVRGRVMEAFGVLPGKPFRARTGELGCWLSRGNLVLRTAASSSGEIHKGDETIDLAAIDEERGARTLVLADGDRAVVSGVGTTVYKIEAYRPPAVMRRGGFQVSPLFFALIAIAFVLHLVVGFTVAYVQPKEEETGEGKEEEVFAVVEMDKPEDPTAPKEIEIEEIQDATQMSEKAPAVTAKHVKKIKEKDVSANSTVSNLLNILNKGSGKPGASNDLKDLVSNIDAVGGAANPAFSIAGAIASLPGEGVNIAKKGGGGYLSTLSGDEVAGKDSGVAKLAKKAKSGKVRGKVTKMSSGAKVKGKLSRADVMRVINSHIAQIQGCYEKALMSNPSLSGRIVFDWTVSSTGKVKGVRVRSSTLGSPKVASCIGSKIKRWKFPKPEGGDVTITFPFLFRSVSS